MKDIIIAYDGTEIIENMETDSICWNLIEEMERLEMESYLYSKIRQERNLRRGKRTSNSLTRRLLNIFNNL